MSQPLDLISRFSPPENEPEQPPPGYICWDDWQEARDKIIEDNLAAVTQVLGSDNVDFFSDCDVEWLKLDMSLPTLNPADEWCDGREYFYDANVRYDCRGDLLMKLRHLVAAVERDIQERPEL